jgi:hypothetical protein
MVKVTFTKEMGEWIDSCKILAMQEIAFVLWRKERVLVVTEVWYMARTKRQRRAGFKPRYQRRRKGSR